MKVVTGKYEGKVNMMKVLYTNDHAPEMNCFGTEKQVLDFLSQWAWYEDSTNEEDLNIPLKEKVQIENVTMWLEGATEEDVREQEEDGVKVTILI